MIVDFTEIKIRQLIADAKDEIEFEVATTLLGMYFAKVINVEIVEGELKFQLKNSVSHQLELPLEQVSQ